MYNVKYIFTLKSLHQNNCFLVLLVEHYELRNQKLFHYQMLVKVLSPLKKPLTSTMSHIRRFPSLINLLFKYVVLDGRLNVLKLILCQR